jgi:hypothetical protein
MACQHCVLEEVYRRTAAMNHLSAAIDEAHVNRARASCIHEGALHETDVKNLDAALSNGVALRAGSRRHELIGGKPLVPCGSNRDRCSVAAFSHDIADGLSGHALLWRPGHDHYCLLRKRDLRVALETLAHLNFNAPARRDTVSDYVRIHELYARSFLRLKVNVDSNSCATHQAGSRQWGVNDFVDDAVGRDGRGQGQRCEKKQAGDRSCDCDHLILHPDAQLKRLASRNCTDVFTGGDRKQMLLRSGLAMSGKYLAGPAVLCSF